MRHMQHLERRMLLAAGQLDPSFAGDGVFSDIVGSAKAIAVQPDGRVIFAGSSGYHDVIGRLDPDGTLDHSFSEDGLAQWAIPGPSGRASEQYTHVVIQPSGNILAAGNVHDVGTQYFIRQIGPTGELLSEVAVAAACESLIISPNPGRPVLYSTTQNTLVFTPQLSLTTTFRDVKGKVAFQGTLGHSLLSLSNNQLTWFNSDGTRNFSFEPMTFSSAIDLATNPRGDIAVLGQRERAATADQDLAVYILRQFGSGTPFTTSFGAPAGLDVEPKGITFQDDGKVLVTAAFEGPDKFIVARVTPELELDRTFGKGGFVVTNMQKGTTETPNTIALAPDQSIYTAGTVNFQKLVMAKYTQDDVLFDETSGVVFVRGTSAADAILAVTGSQRVAVSINGVFNPLQPQSERVKSLFVQSFAGNDSFTNRTAVPAYVAGGDGDDVLIGGIANDTLVGGAGKNRLFGDAGDDRLAGSSGHDSLSGDSGNDRLYGNFGNDTLIGGGGVDRLFGGAGPDFLSGGGSNDKLYGEADDDTLYGGSGADVIDGGEDEDSGRIDEKDLPQDVEIPL